MANFKSNENHVFYWVCDVGCGRGLAEGFRQVRDGWYGFWCGYGCGRGGYRYWYGYGTGMVRVQYGTGTVRVRYGYGTGTYAVTVVRGYLRWYRYGRYGTWVRFSYPCTVQGAPPTYNLTYNQG